MYDSWDVMTSGAMPSYFYGQEYDYTQQDGVSSSGVAAYEPQIGADENVWRQPIANDKRNLLAPDIKNYQEMPFGEQFFPSPQVGYSRVTIKDLSRAGVTRTATGKVVHEFYTSKDFPTIVKRTTPHIERLKLPVFAYFFSLSIDEMSASQGFVVETNDMAGKPKSQMVYPEGQTEPITKVEYFYQSEPTVIDGVSARRLVNDVVTIQKDGTTSTNTIGLVFEGFADFRKSASNSVSGSVQANINFTAPFIVAGSVIPSGSYERTSFRSSSFTKVIERFGVLENTKATDLGSIVETRTLAYDAETGAALLTETATDFKDKVYNFSYPAHWYYEGMGQAYKNIDFNKSFPLSALQVVNGTTSQLNASHGFFVGDEVGYVTTSNSALIAWVVEVTPTQIKLMDKNGSLINASIVSLKLLRSGRKNMQNTPIGSIVLRSNPLNGLKTNIFENVLQAGAVEYTEDWNTFCECFLNNTNTVYTTNPYVLGLKGIYRPKASYVHLAGRTQAYVNNNSNIREDGMFTSFLPFYRMQNGLWNINKSNWTYTSSVVEFSPFGQAIETVDALNRFSSSVYGYNQSLPLAVATNTRYRQLGFDGFEDYNYDNCSDNHFRVGKDQEIVENQAHTGRRSIKVSANNPVTFETLIVDECEDNPCDMQVEIEKKPFVKGESNAQMTLSVSNGTPEYQIEYEVLQGESIMTTNENGSSWIFNASGQAGTNFLFNTVLVIIKDSKGCTFQDEIKF
ncbi:MAG: hypothetical protein HYR91_15440 [Flavobacteriia bacterium]|nr:hypothetical protein [Flavobacteriia bacterium]